MKTRIFIVILAALTLAGCGSLFGGGDHRPMRAEQSEEWHPPSAMLLKYDANHDGKVTRYEMEEGLKADFARADAKHTGCLNQDEVRAVNQERWNTDRAAASPLVDFKGQGCIDFDEFAATPRSLFDQLDRNGDGILEKDELNPKAAAPGNGEERMERGRRGRGGDETQGQDTDGD